MTQGEKKWAEIWWKVLLGVLLLMLTVEAISWIFAGSPDYTLSDTIRRWTEVHTWLPAVVGISFLLLWAHLFLRRNRHDE